MKKWIITILKITLIIIAVLFIITVLFASYFFIPYYLTKNNFFGSNTYTNTGQIGDTFGGIFGPVIGILGVITTFIAFFIQYKTNKEQKDQFFKQAIDLKIERFENRFFELIKIHRENINEIKINNINSHKVFISLFNEFRACFHFVYSVKINKFSDIKLSKKDLVDIAFVLFYVGVGENSTPLSSKLLSRYNESFINAVIEELSNIKECWYDKTNKLFKYNILPIDDLPRLNIVLNYRPFEGHISRLGHYFRHLWQTVKYLDTQDESIIKNKYDYIKLFRAQISNYEQLLIHYNSLTQLGRVWIDEGLIQKYKLIKNIPIPLTYFGPNPEEMYPQSDFFEWNELE